MIKYTCNENYFSNIDDSDKAYILGFIYADGHLSKNGELKLIIQPDDESILNFIKFKMDSDTPIRYVYRKVKDILKPYSSFIICRKPIFNDLWNIGIRHNKSKNNLPWPEIKSDFISHFLRGIFDGDGCIWNKQKSSWGCSFAGGFDLLNNIKQELNKQGIHCNPIKIPKRKNGLYGCSLDITHRDNIKKFYTYLYSDSTFHLERKYQRFLTAFKDISEWERKHNIITSTLADNIIRLYNTRIKQKDISLKLNIKYSTVRACIQRSRKDKLCI